ncbi:hypothetical protein LN893_13540 [Pontibacter sp. XAAS-A31]|nr:hypothetical protein [Pontibacter harenae]
MALHIEQVKVLETPETAQVKKQANADHLAFTHNRGALGRLPQQKGLSGSVEFPAKLIHKAKNFRNFRVVNHREGGLDV